MNPTLRVMSPMAAFLAAVVCPHVQAGEISIASVGTAYVQNFNMLAATDTSSALPDGWAIAESGTNANGSYTAGTGGSNGGDTYSFGTSGSSDRALGGLQSGNLIPTIGVGFVNRTGGPLVDLVINYFGEQWRLGTTGRVDQLDFQYSINAASLTTGSWMDVDALDFVSPTTATAGALNGNLDANRTEISHAITGLSIANGATFWLRWRDFNASGSDDGLAIDDFSLTAWGASQPPGTNPVPDQLPLAAIAAAFAGMLALPRFRPRLG